MAKWITHTMIVDYLMDKGLNLDLKGFCVGNIAPDCNVENEDWTSFIPPKEVTHFMDGHKKSSANYERFYKEYIQDKKNQSKEHLDFLLGYYAHLITDVEFHKFIRDEERVSNTYSRIKTNDYLNSKIIGLPENFDTIKRVFGTKDTFKDIEYIEHQYLNQNPDASYLTILCKIDSFNDYLDFLPENAIVRKLGVMMESINSFEERDLYFFTQDEYERFVVDTSELIYQLINDKLKKC